MHARIFGHTVKSIQPISIAVSHNSGDYTSDTTTITAVDLARTLLFLKTEASQLSTPWGAGSAYLASATQVVWPMHIAGTGFSRTLKADVVEFAEPFKSIQWVQGGAATRTINAVDTAKTAILSCNWSAGDVSSQADAVLTNATTVTLTGSHACQYWCVVEFY